MSSVSSLSQRERFDHPRVRAGRSWWVTAATTVILLTSGCQNSPNGTSAPATSAIGSQQAEVPADPTRPLGGDNASATTLDDSSARWFDTLCSGLQPLQGYLRGGTFAGGSTTGTETEQTGQGFSDGGAELQRLAATLKSMPLPTFPGGEEFALEATANVDQIGGIFVRAGERMTAGDEAWADELDADVLINGGPLRDLATAAPSTQIAEQISAIPSCAKNET